MFRRTRARSFSLPATIRSPRLAVAAAAIVTIAAVAAGSVLTALPSSATIGSPSAATTAAGTTSVVPTAGKASGSGLWGYVGDVKTRPSGSGGLVFSYGIDVSPADGSLWVTDSAKIVWTTSSFVCALNGGTLVSPGTCYAGDSRLHRYPQRATPDWSIGQYQANGAYGGVAVGDNAGIGANFATLADSATLDGTTMPSGQFGGVRGVAVTTDGVAWALDSDAVYDWLGNAKHSVRMVNPDGTEAGAFGRVTWASGNTWTNRNDPESFDYPVGITRMPNGNMVVTSQTPELLKEYTADGTFVRNIFLHRPADSAYPGDSGYRSPYAVASDSAGNLLVGYVDPGSGKQSFIERIDPGNCSTEAVGNPDGSFRDRCAVLGVIGLGTLATGDGSTNATFAIEVDPLTGDIYVGQRSGLLRIFAADGTPKGTFSPFGNGTANGQTSLVRGIAFDQRGFMYLTVAEGTSSTRVVIFARTPDPVAGAGASYSCAVDGSGQRTGLVDETSAVLSWNALSTGVTADGQVPLRDYVVERSLDGGASWAVVSTPVGTNATETITGLTPGTNPQFRVSAWNEAGNGDTATIAVVTSPDCTLPVGSVTVSKRVTGSTAPGTASYDFTLSCTLLGQPVTLAAADAAFSLSGGGSRTVSAPEGASCTAAETTTGAFATSIADSSGTATDGVVTISSAAGATIEFTNAYPEPGTGSLLVSKVVTGAGAPASDSFSFTVACTAGGTPVVMSPSDAAFSLSNGGSRTIGGLPAASSCTVTEASLAGYAASFVSTGGATDGTAVITDGGVSSVTVTNAYTAPASCVADEDSVSVVYSTQNNANAPLDGSTVVYDRVTTGRDDMKLVYTIEKPCVSYPVPVLSYSGDWAISDPASGTYATFTFTFGAKDQATATAYSAQLAAMNALVAGSPQCQNRSIDNFVACLRPIIQAYGSSVPVGITGTVTVSVAATTPGQGSLRFFLEQDGTGTRLSPEGQTPYVVTQPSLALSAVGQICSATLQPYSADGFSYTPNNAAPVPLSIAATAQDDGIEDDDVTVIPLTLAGLKYLADGTTFSDVATLSAHLRGLSPGSYAIGASYLAPDGVAAPDAAPRTITVLGSDDARCFLKAAISSTGPSMPVTGANLPVLPIAIVAVLAMLAGAAFILIRRRRS